MPKKEITLTIKFSITEEDEKSLYIQKILEYYKDGILGDMKKGGKEHNVQLDDVTSDIKIS